MSPRLLSGLAGLLFGAAIFANFAALFDHDLLLYSWLLLVTSLILAWFAGKPAPQVTE